MLPFIIHLQNGFRVLSVDDGNRLLDAITLVNDDEADGMNLGFIRNFPCNLEPLQFAMNIKFLAINDYDHSKPYDYSIIHKLKTLRGLSIYTTDRKQIDFTNFPNLEQVALMWRPKATSLLECSRLKRLFLGMYNGQDLVPFHKLINLTYLRINTGSLRSLKGIGSMQNLTELWLMQATKLEHIVEIKDLTNLKYLRIDNCRNIKDISILEQLEIRNIELVGTTPRV